jgi:hypothetical protein
MYSSVFENGWLNVIGPSGGITFKGRMLGETDSHQDQHNGHTNEYATRGERCYACRWSLYRIYEVYELDTPTLVAFGDRYKGKYLVCSFGMTIIPGEEIFRRIHATNSPAEVVELLTTRKSGHAPVLTAVAARLLARVSDIDQAIQEAYDNRTVL